MTSIHNSTRPFSRLTLGALLTATVSLSTGCSTALNASPQDSALAPMASTFVVQSETLAPGVYQSAYSARNGHLYATSAVGRPPVKASQLLKIDPISLAIKARVSPAPQSSRQDGQLNAVYGVGVDDAHGNIWVTNTRSGSIAVYRESDLALVKQFPDDITPHSRDVVIDTTHSRAYVSSPVSNLIHVFDTTTLKTLPDIVLQGSETQPPKLMSLALDATHGKLYTVSLNTNELYVIDTASQRVEKTFALQGVEGASGIGIDSQNQQAYIAAQKSGNVLIVDARTGAILHRIATGAGALNVVFDPQHRLAYVANRTANTVTVIDPQGRIHAQIPTGSFPNHISVDGQGNAFVLNKAKGPEDSTGDHITRIHPKGGSNPK